MDLNRIVLDIDKECIIRDIKTHLNRMNNIENKVYKLFHKLKLIEVHCELLTKIKKDLMCPYCEDYYEKCLLPIHIRACGTLF